MRKDLLTLTWEEISEIPSEKLVVFAGAAPIEEHGKHLPIGVDIYETKEWIKRASQLLEQALPDYCFAQLPVLPLGYANMGDFPGNIHISRKLLYEIVYQSLHAISNWGVQNIVVISGHADVLHTITIEQACEKINKEKGLVSFAPMGSIFHGGQKGGSKRQAYPVEQMIEQFPNDFHAGWIETSSMLDIAPALVKNNYRERPDIELAGKDMMDSDKVITAIRGEGHIGYPKKASAQIGHLLNEDMGTQIKEAVFKFVHRQGYEGYMHHPLYDIPALKLQI